MFSCYLWKIFFKGLAKLIIHINTVTLILKLELSNYILYKLPQIRHSRSPMNICQCKFGSFVQQYRLLIFPNYCFPNFVLGSYEMFQQRPSHFLYGVVYAHAFFRSSPCRSRHCDILWQWFKPCNGWKNTVVVWSYWKSKRYSCVQVLLQLGSMIATIVYKALWDEVSLITRKDLHFA